MTRLLDLVRKKRKKKRKEERQLEKKYNKRNKRNKICLLTLSFHSNGQALSHPAILATITVSFTYRAATGYPTSIIEALLDTSLKEKFASLACICPIMPSCRMVATN
jgi:hypothetical protein